MAKTMAATRPIEGPWDLPHGWSWERIDAVAPVNPRRAPDGLPGDTEVPFVPMAAVQAKTGGIDVSARRCVDTVRKGFTRFASGDVIFAKITPCMENGKIAVVPALPHGVGYGSTEFHVLSPRDVSSRYLYYWVSQRGFRETAEFNMTGTAGQKRVPTEFMRDALIPVPPVEVQDVIVTRVDELFVDIDEGEAALSSCWAGLDSQKLLGLAATLRQSILAAAFRGELV
ncbi:restriction endonuclease subunit S [Sphingomonas sp. Leaf33]|uniref:restriction endonuclease subunit S n=1 Tax=Sphingomonas sp. Leaf33 TaxID=1736215 RepID=UPI0009EA90CD|nr:restriction endonuclease subunit S [Sphingomonas sp. Leaf33]